MTIQFYCPNCNALMAFESKHIGKRARCLKCSQIVIIPSKNYQKPQKIKPPREKNDRPLPGFYKAVLIDTWKIFFKIEGITALVFITAAVCFKFFTGHVDYSFTMGMARFQAPVGLIVTLAAWGCLFWYYMEIINAAAFDCELLPDVYMGGLFDFIWNIVKSIYLFVFSLMVVQLPCIIAIGIIRKTGFDSPLFLHTLVAVGLFLFPMAILTVAVARDLAMLRPDYLLTPVIKAFLPYTLVAALLILAWQLQFWTIGYGQIQDEQFSIIAIHLLANLGVQIIAIIAMRSIGLFYRHYRCYLKW